MDSENARNQDLIHPDFVSPELLLAAIVDSSDDAIVSKNLDGIVTSWNPGAERIFGYTAEEMIGQSILRIIPPERHPEETTILKRIERGERIEHMETMRIRKDGSEIEVSLTISPVKRADGKVVGGSKIARDITQQKQAMRNLQEANEKLAKADRMKVEFISTVSHELRTPLNAIVGWMDFLKESPSAQDINEGFEVIGRNVRILTQLINDLLDMSRIESGKLALDLQRVDLIAAVQAAIDTVHPAAEAKGMRITCAFGSVHGAVMGDRNRLQQIFWNLLTNAVKFTPKGGRVHVTIERANSHVEVCITDTGIGIAPAFLPRVFERFSQAEASHTRSYSGLGIGLSIARHLAEMQGGSIFAKSAGLGRGATFCVHLPMMPVHQEPERVETERRVADVEDSLPETDLQGIDVLLVDDEKDSSTIVARILEKKGAAVRVANSMEAAIAEIERCVPRVLLSDIGMPGHDGYELIARVRALPQCRKLPAVALTALARSEDRTRSLRAGFQMHVAKPVEAAELVAVVRNLASLSEK